MKQILCAMLAVLGLVGCSAVLSNNGPHNVIAPTPKTEAGKGKVAYNPDGLPELVRLRRHDALDKIAVICEHNYKIEKEEEVTPETINGGIAMIGANRAHILHFSCNK